MKYLGKEIASSQRQNGSHFSKYGGWVFASFFWTCWICWSRHIPPQELLKVYGPNGEPVFFFLKKTASPPHTPTPPTFPPFSVGVPLSAICAKFNQLPFFQYYCFISGSGRIEVYLVNDGLKFPPSSTRGFVCPPQKALVGAAAGHQGKAGHPIHTCRPNTGSTKWRENVHAL